VVAGLEVAKFVFRTLDPDCKIQFLCAEGEEIVAAPHPIAVIEGNARAMLIAERTALNLIQRLSGIATTAHKFAVQAREKGIAVVDTRKTTPGLRTLEKYAVQAGGAANHRYGLFDAILIKDNHIRVAGGVSTAIQLARRHFPDMPVEVEAANFQDIDEALAEKAEKIMLDNMTPEQIKQAVALIDQRRGDGMHRPLIEVSGGVNADNFASYLIDGVNAISIGALTHSVRSMDISLNIEV
jgi:nicotinate-nucleotide pyrophosphorylase (carboxylating)